MHDKCLHVLFSRSFQNHSFYLIVKCLGTQFKKMDLNGTDDLKNVYLQLKANVGTLTSLRSELSGSVEAIQSSVDIVSHQLTSLRSHMKIVDEVDAMIRQILR
jgi:uncharacterized protein YkvS